MNKSHSHETEETSQVKYEQPRGRQPRRKAEVKDIDHPPRSNPISPLTVISETAQQNMKKFQDGQKKKGSPLQHHHLLKETGGQGTGTKKEPLSNLHATPKK